MILNLIFLVDILVISLYYIQCKWMNSKTLALTYYIYYNFKHFILTFKMYIYLHLNSHKSTSIQIENYINTVG